MNPRLTFHFLCLALVFLSPVQGQPWPQLGPSYDIATFEPVTPAVLGPRESVYLGHGLNSIEGQPNEPANLMGSGFAVGDVNGDGRNDLIVASAGGNTGASTRLHTGGLWIWLNTDMGGIHDAAGILGSAPDVRIVGADADDALSALGGNSQDGSVVTVGDCTGDGIADILVHTQVGAGPGNAREGAGEACLFFGRTTWPAFIDLANPTPAARADVIIYGEMGDGIGGDSGGKMADLTGDGIAEVILPAPGRGDAPNRLPPGEVMIFRGRAAGAWPAEIDLAVAGSIDTRILGPFENTTVAPVAGQRGGFATADLNGDSIDDLIITARGANGPVSSRDDCGGAFILFGRATWPPYIDLTPTTAQPHADVRILGIDQADQLGSSGTILTGDCDGDGHLDLILSAELGDGPANARSGAGEAYLIWGRSTWPAVIDLATAANVGCTIYGATAGGLNGDRLTRSEGNRSSSAIGDVNGDGLADILLGSPNADGPGESRPGGGEVYLILGRPRAQWPAVIDTLPTAVAAHPDCTIYGLAAQQGAGAAQSDKLSDYRTLVVGDVSGDGKDDILVGAVARYLPISYGGPGAFSSHGAAFLINGRDGVWPGTIDIGLAPGTVGGPDTMFRGAPYSRLAFGGAMGMGDLDGDGGLDIILGNKDYSYYPAGKLGEADEPGDRNLCGGVWVWFGATPPPDWFAQAVAQLPALAATMQMTAHPDGSVTFSYERDEIFAQHVSYKAEGSFDMQLWTPMPAPPQIVSLGNGFERVTHTYAAPVPTPLFGNVTVSPLP